MGTGMSKQGRSAAMRRTRGECLSVGRYSDSDLGFRHRLVVSVPSFDVQSQSFG